MLKYLLDNGADINDTNNVRILDDQLNEINYNLRRDEQDGMNALLIATNRSKMKNLNFLLERRQDIHYRDNVRIFRHLKYLIALYKRELLLQYGQTAYLHAAMSGNVEVLKLLLKRGAKKDDLNHVYK